MTGLVVQHVRRQSAGWTSTLSTSSHVAHQVYLLHPALGVTPKPYRPTVGVIARG